MSASPQTPPIATLMLAAFASMFAQRACDAMLPAIASDLGRSLAAAGQSIGAFALGYGVAQLMFGPLGDRFGKQRVIASACFACALANLAAAAAPSLAALLAARLAGGAGAAAVIPLGMAWIGDAVPYRARQATLARLMIGTVLGLVAAQSLGGFVAVRLGWRTMFLIVAVLFALCALRLRAGQDRSAARHGAGSAWLAVTARPWARTVLLVTFVEGTAIFGVLAWLPVHLSQTHGVELTRAGLVSATYGLGALAFLAAAAPLLAQLGERGLAASGGALFAAAVAVLLMPLPLGWSVPACGLAGLGFYMLHNTLQVHATQMAPEHRGTAVSLFAAALFLGQSAGVALAAAAQNRGRLDAFFALAGGVVLLLGLTMAIRIGRRNSCASPP